MVQQFENKPEHTFKVLVLGDISTGKTSFIKRCVYHFFSRAYKANVGVDFALQTLQYDDNTQVQLQLWDIAGQERFASLARVYYKDAMGAFLVFDLNRPKTLQAVERWKKDLDLRVSLSDGSLIPCLLLANKCDLVQRTEEDKKKLTEFAEQNGFIDFLYTSPKDNINIETAARLLAREMMRRQENLDRPRQDDRTDTIVITDQYNRQAPVNQGNKSSCCGW